MLWWGVVILCGQGGGRLTRWWSVSLLEGFRSILSDFYYYISSSFLRWVYAQFQKHGTIGTQIAITSYDQIRKCGSRLGYGAVCFATE
jgi:hypothetical protein